MSKSKFVQMILAKIKGDKQEVTVLRNEKLAVAAIKGQLSAIETAIIKQEIDVANALEQYENTITSTTVEGDVTPIGSSEDYIRNVRAAHLEYEEQKEYLEELKETQEYWNSLMLEYFAG